MVVKADDRVRITLERDVLYDNASVIIDGNVIRLENLMGAVIEVIIPPIVLPTKKNALVEVNNWQYVRDCLGGDYWLTAGLGQRINSDELQEKVNNNRSTYRVIFEGEES